MPNESLTGALLEMRQYYDTGATRLYSFRRQQLLILKQTVLKYENELNRALYEDLGKPRRKDGRLNSVCCFKILVIH